MQETRQTTIITNNPARIRKKIDKTTYEVEVYFGKTSNENVYDKLKRIILNDYAKLTNLSECPNEVLLL